MPAIEKPENADAGNKGMDLGNAGQTNGLNH